MAHYLYLIRHGEQQDAEYGMPDGPLSDRGAEQAMLVAERLADVPFTRTLHSPLRRAAETAEIMAERLSGPSPQPSNLLFDCIPSGPSPEMPKAFESFYGSVTEAEIEAGTAQMSDAVEEFLTPARDERNDLLITHNFVIAWLVREVLEAPDWRWMGINQANCGLTIIRLRSAKPPIVITHNDLGHLPIELRTGLPEPHPV